MNNQDEKINSLLDCIEKYVQIMIDLNADKKICDFSSYRNNNEIRNILKEDIKKHISNLIEFPHQEYNTLS
jgi:hypothetical protein